MDEETSSESRVITNHDNRQTVDEETSSETVELSPIMTIDRQWMRKQAVTQLSPIKTIDRQCMRKQAVRQWSYHQS